jgi:hypothetical protein
MSGGANGPATISFTAYMRLFKAYSDAHGDVVDWPWVATAPKFAFEDYADFVNGAAIVRGLCPTVKVWHVDYPLSIAWGHAKRELDRAIEAEDWDAARAWLRPGVAHHYKTYNACEQKYPAQLGETARQGRADGLRETIWRKLVNETRPWLRSDKASPSMQKHIAFHALHELNEMNRRFPLNRVDLRDDRFGDGTVLEVWLKEVHPYLTHRRPEFAIYETELRIRSPMPSNAQLALAQGMHARLGAASSVQLLTDELARMIVNTDTTPSHPPPAPLYRFKTR